MEVCYKWGMLGNAYLHTDRHECGCCKVWAIITAALAEWPGLISSCRLRLRIITHCIYSSACLISSLSHLSHSSSQLAFTHEGVSTWLSESGKASCLAQEGGIWQRLNEDSGDLHFAFNVAGGCVTWVPAPWGPISRWATRDTETDAPCSSRILSLALPRCRYAVKQIRSSFTLANSLKTSDLIQPIFFRCFCF